MLSRIYNPFDWYWRATDGRLFSSARGKTVLENDEAFTAWSQQGQPTAWPKDDAGGETAAALQDVLAPYGLRVGA